MSRREIKQGVPHHMHEVLLQLPDALSQPPRPPPPPPLARPQQQPNSHAPTPQPPAPASDTAVPYTALPQQQACADVMLPDTAATAVAVRPPAAIANDAAALARGGPAGWQGLAARNTAARRPSYELPHARRSNFVQHVLMVPEPAESEGGPVYRSSRISPPREETSQEHLARWVAAASVHVVPTAGNAASPSGVATGGGSALAPQTGGHRLSVLSFRADSPTPDVQPPQGAAGRLWQLLLRPPSDNAAAPAVDAAGSIGERGGGGGGSGVDGDDGGSSNTMSAEHLAAVAAELAAWEDASLLPWHWRLALAPHVRCCLWPATYFASATYADGDDPLPNMASTADATDVGGGGGGESPLPPDPVAFVLSGVVQCSTGSGSSNMVLMSAGNSVGAPRQTALPPGTANAVSLRALRDSEVAVVSRRLVCTAVHDRFQVAPPTPQLLLQALDSCSTTHELLVQQQAVPGGSGATAAAASRSQRRVSRLAVPTTLETAAAQLAALVVPPPLANSRSWSAARTLLEGASQQQQQQQQQHPEKGDVAGLLSQQSNVLLDMLRDVAWTETHDGSAGLTLLRAGEVAPAVYVVLEGRLALRCAVQEAWASCPGPDDPLIQLAELGPGTCVGGLSLLQPGLPLWYSAAVADDCPRCKLLALPRDVLAAYLEEQRQQQHGAAASASASAAAIAAFLDALYVQDFDLFRAAAAKQAAMALAGRLSAESLTDDMQEVLKAAMLQHDFPAVVTTAPPRPSSQPPAAAAAAEEEEAPAIAAPAAAERSTAAGDDAPPPPCSNDADSAVDSGGPAPAAAAGAAPRPSSAALRAPLPVTSYPTSSPLHMQHIALLLARQQHDACMALMRAGSRAWGDQVAQQQQQQQQQQGVLRPASGATLGSLQSLPGAEVRVVPRRADHHRSPSPQTTGSRSNRASGLLLLPATSSSSFSSAFLGRRSGTAAASGDPTAAEASSSAAAAASELSEALIAAVTAQAGAPPLPPAQLREGPDGLPEMPLLYPGVGIMRANQAMGTNSNHEPGDVETVPRSLEEQLLKLTMTVMPEVDAHHMAAAAAAAAVVEPLSDDAAAAAAAATGLPLKPSSARMAVARQALGSVPDTPARAAATASPSPSAAHAALADRSSLSRTPPTPSSPPFTPLPTAALQPSRLNPLRRATIATLPSRPLPKPESPPVSPHYHISNDHRLPRPQDEAEAGWARQEGGASAAAAAAAGRGYVVVDRQRWVRNALHDPAGLVALDRARSGRSRDPGAAPLRVSDSGLGGRGVPLGLPPLTATDGDMEAEPLPPPAGATAEAAAAPTASGDGDAGGAWASPQAEPPSFVTLHHWEKSRTQLLQELSQIAPLAGLPSALASRANNARQQRRATDSVLVTASAAAKHGSLAALQAPATRAARAAAAAAAIAASKASGSTAAAPAPASARSSSRAVSAAAAAAAATADGDASHHQPHASLGSSLTAIEEAVKAKYSAPIKHIEIEVPRFSSTVGFEGGYYDIDSNVTYFD